MTFLIDSEPLKVINWWLLGGGVATMALLMIIMAVALRLKPSLGKFSTHEKARGAELVSIVVLLGIFYASAYFAIVSPTMETRAAQEAAVVSVMEDELSLTNIAPDEARTLRCVEEGEESRTYVEAVNENGEPVTGTLHRSAEQGGTCEYRFTEES